MVNTGLEDLENPSHLVLLLLLLLQLLLLGRR